MCQKEKKHVLDELEDFGFIEQQEQAKQWLQDIAMVIT